MHPSLLLSVMVAVTGVGEWVGQRLENLGLDLFANGLGDLLLSIDTVDLLGHVTTLNRNRFVDSLWRLDAVLGSHLVTTVLDGGDGGGSGNGWSGHWSNVSVTTVEAVEVGVSLGLGLSLALDQSVMVWSWAML